MPFYPILIQWYGFGIKRCRRPIRDVIAYTSYFIVNEHDNIELTEELIDVNHYTFSARLEVDYLNETYKINLPESENYETLGGLIVDHKEEIPQQNEIVIIDKFQFTILEVSNTKIDLVELKIKEEE